MSTRWWFVPKWDGVRFYRGDLEDVPAEDRARALPTTRELIEDTGLILPPEPDGDT